MKLFAAVVLFTLSAGATRADFYDGNELYEMCASRKEAVTLYVIGVYDGYATTSEAYSKQRQSCLSGNVRGSQLGDVTCNYLRDHPEQRQYTASSTALAALISAFPCK